MRPSLLQRAQKLQPKKAKVAGSVLAKDAGCDRRSLRGDGARGSRGRSRNGEVNDLIWSKDVGRGNTGARGANVERLGQFDELGARGVRASHENGNLELDPRRATGWKMIQALPYLRSLGFHDDEFS